MFGNRSMGMFGKRPLPPSKRAPIGAQTLPGPMQSAPPPKPAQMISETLPGPANEAGPGPMQGPQPTKPGSRLAKTLLNMQFNREPTSPFTAIAGLADIGADAWNERRARRAGVYQTEE